MSDNRLAAIKNGDKAAFEELLGSYEPLILAETARTLSGFEEFSGEAEEMRQEGRLALYDAAMGYRENTEVTFGLYAKVCIHNRLVSYLRKLVSRKRREQRAAALARAEAEKGRRSADDIAYAYERSEEVRRLLESEATELEKAVFLMYLEKKSYAEIAREIGRSAKSVDNAISRVKAKIKKGFKKQ